MTTLLAASCIVACGDDGGEADGMPVKGTVPDGAAAAMVHAELVGSFELTFGNAQPGAPFEAGETATFVIGDDNTLTVFGKTISDPYVQNGNAAEIIWNDGELAWALSNNESGVFNEINVADASSMAWLGQWADASKFEGEPADEGHVGRDLELEIDTKIDSPMLMAPYDLGTAITINWDGAETLTVKAGGESSTPTYVGETEPAPGPAVYGEEDVVRLLTWKDGSDTEGREFVLKLEPEDHIAVVEIRAYKVLESGSRIEATSAARVD